MNTVPTMFFRVEQLDDGTFSVYSYSEDDVTGLTQHPWSKMEEGTDCPGDAIQQEMDYRMGR